MTVKNNFYCFVLYAKLDVTILKSINIQLQLIAIACNCL